ncbi:hypothetical protein AZE42_12118 [Rhizopogon vesiculosus]|uniref:Uncharacterized protein n=1 Tax=Rhizopogon vesiculosus TaxID=180088 RepID=A0A1J8Q3T0_9AGAM|nr:hypothetical protein AZE42_12118 [Rhizopogon vesiculosus]
MSSPILTLVQFLPFVYLVPFLALMSPSTEPEVVGRNMLIVSIILSGLMVLEYAWNIYFEMRVIWPQFWKSTEAKIFVIVRGLFSRGNRTHDGSTADDSKLVLPRDALLPLIGRLVLDKERFLQESGNDRQLTEVDLDNLEPLEDCDISSARPSDSKVTTAIDFELGVGAEEDIAGGYICDQADDAAVSSCAHTMMSVETGNGSEGSGN